MNKNNSYVILYGILQRGNATESFVLHSMRHELGQGSKNERNTEKHMY